MSISEDDSMVLQVTLPPDSVCGQLVTVSSPDGRLFEISVPEGVRPGDKINVVVQKQTSQHDKVPSAPEDNSRSDASAPPIGEGHGNVNNYRSNEEEINEGNEASGEESHTDPRSVAAASGATVGGIIVGCILLGPVVGTVVGGTLIGASTLYASQRSDGVGETLRYGGAITADAASFTYRKAKEYKVVETVKETTSTLFSAANEVNREYKITDTIKSTASSAYNGIKDVNEQHDITGKISGAFTATGQRLSEIDNTYNVSGNLATGAVKAKDATLKIASGFMSMIGANQSESEES